MPIVRTINTDAYDYALPETAIAQVPAEPRTAARLLDALDPDGALCHRTVAELPGLLGPGDVLAVNETKVIPARLILQKGTGGRVEVLLLEPVAGSRPIGGPVAWEALVRPLKRCPPGTELFDPATRECVGTVGERCDDGTRAVVTFTGTATPMGVGSIALPPYISVPLEDPDRYQTVYARTPGSVAAPTAGLHFTAELLEKCRATGARIVTVDLAVGLGTFRPIATDRVEDHVMHAERYAISRETMEVCESARRVMTVGTTTVRALEAAAATGELSGRTDLFIHGDYPFRIVDVLMTNFHLPRSSLLVMLEAFCGTRWRGIYETALSEGYRFLSFGDAMIVGREGSRNPGSMAKATQ